MTLTLTLVIDVSRTSVSAEIADFGGSYRLSCVFHTASVAVIYNAVGGYPVTPDNEPPQ